MIFIRNDLEEEVGERVDGQESITFRGILTFVSTDIHNEMEIPLTITGNV